MPSFLPRFYPGGSRVPFSFFLLSIFFGTEITISKLAESDTDQLQNSPLQKRNYIEVFINLN